MTRIVAFSILAALGLVLAGCGGGAASPDRVAVAAGATSCDNSGFYLESKVSNDKETIYDCRFATALPKCVTYSGNIADNATAEVALLFSSSISGQGKPACLAEWRAAKARAAARLAAKREGQYETALSSDAHATWHRGYTAVTTGLSRYELPNIYYKFVTSSGGSCADYATYGCFKVEVVTRNGCSADLSVELGEYATQGGTRLGTIDGSAGALAPTETAIVELDEDQAGINWGQVESASCY